MISESMVLENFSGCHKRQKTSASKEGVFIGKNVFSERSMLLGILDQRESIIHRF